MALKEWYLYTEGNQPKMVFDSRELALAHLERDAVINPTEAASIKRYRAETPPMGGRVYVVKWDKSPDRVVERIYGPTEEQVAEKESK